MFSASLRSMCFSLALVHTALAARPPGPGRANHHTSCPSVASDSGAPLFSCIHRPIRECDDGATGGWGTTSTVEVSSPQPPIPNSASPHCPIPNSASPHCRDGWKQGKLCDVTKAPFSARNGSNATMQLQTAINTCGNLPEGGTVLVPSGFTLFTASLFLRCQH